jgi:hypothetical protein
MIRTRAIGVLAAALAVACSSPTADDAAARTPREARLSAAGGIVASTTGGGVAELPPGFGLLRFSFAAHQHAKGKALGTFRQYREREGLTIDFHGEVTCVTTAPDPLNPQSRRAWVGGVVTENNSTHPAFQTPVHQVGEDVWFRVVDNGEGSGAPPDRTTVLGFVPAGGFFSSAAYCAGQPWLAGGANTFPLTDGNIQVHD